MRVNIFKFAFFLSVLQIFYIIQIFYNQGKKKAERFEELLGFARSRFVETRVINELGILQNKTLFD